MEGTIRWNTGQIIAVLCVGADQPESLSSVLEALNRGEGEKWNFKSLYCYMGCVGTDGSLPMEWSAVYADEGGTVFTFFFSLKRWIDNWLNAVSWWPQDLVLLNACKWWANIYRRWPCWPLSSVCSRCTSATTNCIRYCLHVGHEWPLHATAHV